MMMMISDDDDDDGEFSLSIRFSIVEEFVNAVKKVWQNFSSIRRRWQTGNSSKFHLFNTMTFVYKAISNNRLYL